MRPPRLPPYVLRLAFYTLLFTILLTACTRALTRLPVPEGIPAGPVLAAFRPADQALVALNARVATAAPAPPQLSLSVPPGCQVWGLHPSPSTRWLAMALECDFGPLVQAVHIDTGELRRMAPDLETDSHFLAWHPDGRSIYLRLNSLRDPRIARMDVHTGSITGLPISPYTYNLAVAPGGERLLYTLTLGIGLGSETWLANADGSNASLLINDPAALVTFARWSPDGRQVAYIRMPDTQVPFTVGQLFVLEDTTDTPTLIAEVDTGHGYAPAWSPDGSRLAFIVRDNPDDPLADVSYAALRSSLAVAELATGAINHFEAPEGARVESPAWSPDGASVVAAVAYNGTIDSWIFNVDGGALLPFGQATLHPVWLPGR